MNSRHMEIFQCSDMYQLNIRYKILKTQDILLETISIFV